jgi:hypothetical protein
MFCQVHADVGGCEPSPPSAASWTWGAYATAGLQDDGKCNTIWLLSMSSLQRIFCTFPFEEKINECTHVLNYQGLV